MLRINLSANAWRNLRRVYADQSIPRKLDLQNRVAGMWLSTLERMAYSSKEAKSELIFVIGHWRSGTTFMHELLCQNENFNFASTYACMNPQVFPMTETAILKHSGRHVSSRPMDNMSISLLSPQEDEFALLALGARSPYEALLFPMVINRAMEAADPYDLTADEMQEWVRIFTRFIEYSGPQ